MYIQQHCASRIYKGNKYHLFFEEKLSHRKISHRENEFAKSKMRVKIQLTEDTKNDHIYPKISKQITVYTYIYLFL